MVVFLFVLIWLMPLQSYSADPLFVAASYREEIQEAVSQYLPMVRTSLIAGQIHQESQWNVQAISKSGAGGLLQIMPKTAKDVAVSCRIDGFDRFNPVHAIRGGVCYDAQVRRWVGKMNTPYEQDTSMLRGYNGGAGFVVKEKVEAVKHGLDPGISKNLEQLCVKFRLVQSCDENNNYAPYIRKWQARYYSAW